MRFLLFAILGSMLLSGAHSPEEVRKILSDREKVNAELFVDPDQFTMEVLQFMPQLNLEQDQLLFRNAMNFLSGMVGGSSDAEVDKWLPPARVLAEKYDDAELRISLKIRAARQSGSNASLETVYRDAIEEAERLGRKGELARYKAELANRYSDWGQMVSALKLVQDAIEISKDPLVKDHVVTLNIKIQAMMIYLDTHMQEEAIQILKELIAGCHERGFFYTEGALLHNLGQAQLDVPAHFADAEQTLGAALTIANRLNNLYLATNIRTQQAELLHRQNRDEEALRLVLQTAAEFVVLENPLREANSYKYAAIYAAALKHWDQALEYGNRAARFFAKDYPNDNERIQRVLYEAHKGLKHTDEALHHMELWAEQKVATDKKKEEQEYQKLSVKFGLDAEREKTLRLEREKEDEQRRRRFTSILLFLTLGLLILAIAAFYQTRRVASSRQRYQEVMEAIDEGILRFDQSLQIQSGYSPYLNTLLDVPNDLAGVSFLDLLVQKNMLDAGNLDILKPTLAASFGEEPLVWQLNEAHLPHELQIGDRILSIHWTPCFDRRNHLDHVVVALRDRTQQNQLERHLAAEKARLAEIPEKLGEIFKAGLGQSQNVFQTAREILEMPTGTVEWRRLLHTVKGNARTLGLRNFAGYIHQLEDGNPEAMSRLQAELNEYQKLLQEVMTDATTVPTSLAAMISPMLPDFRNRITAEGLAYDQVCIRDGVLAWPAEQMSFIKNILTHALQNALDHGYLRPRQRGWTPSPFFCEIRALRRIHQLVLEIKDQGAGIDFAALRQRTHMPQASQAVLIEQLFEDGVSTAEHITDTSGRGIGLAAIRGFCEQLGGTVTLRPGEDQRGVTLLVEVPHYFKD